MNRATRTIGTNSLVVLICFVGAALFAIFSGALGAERLRGLPRLALFAAGSFATVVGAFAFRFFRLGARSRQALRYQSGPSLWGEEASFLETRRGRLTLADPGEEMWELSSRAKLAATLAVALLVALPMLDLMTVARFSALADAGPGSQVCQPQVHNDQPPVADANAPGCALVRRAFALGYADSLGDCAPTPQKSQERRCTLRQYDEPWAHYAWRNLREFGASVGALVGGSTLRSGWRNMTARFHRLPALTEAQRQVLLSTPHATHHLFTNLPDPHNGAFSDDTCSERYRVLAPRPPTTKDPSHVFEHILAQLLFETRYDGEASTCREVMVHWDATLDTCARLAQEPERVLVAANAMQDVDAVLRRHRVKRELAALGLDKAPAPAAWYVTFACYLETGAPGRTSRTTTLGDNNFSVEELRVTPVAAADMLAIDRYRAVSSLLVRGFHYGALLSEAGLDSSGAAGARPSLSGQDFALTRLYALDEVDLYLDPGWLQTRPDLLEVYPYQRHFKNYVQLFRRQFRREKGRL